MEKYLIRRGKLCKIRRINDVVDEMYLVDDDGSLLIYQEHLDGWLIDEEEARDLYPEEFV